MSQFKHATFYTINRKTYFFYRRFTGFPVFIDIDPPSMAGILLLYYGLFYGSSGGWVSLPAGAIGARARGFWGYHLRFGPRYWFLVLGFLSAPRTLNGVAMVDRPHYHPHAPLLLTANLVFFFFSS